MYDIYACCLYQMIFWDVYSLIVGDGTFKNRFGTVFAKAVAYDDAYLRCSYNSFYTINWGKTRFLMQIGGLTYVGDKCTDVKIWINMNIVQVSETSRKFSVHVFFSKK